MRKKNNINLNLLIKAVLMSIIPLLAVFVYTAIQGHGFLSVFLPDSGWNDELFYYKMVESVLEYKCPRGFFGFNESRALYYSFAAWSPVILFQWVLWGLVFGWNLLSPIISNIVFLGIALFIFVILVKPSNKEFCFTAVLLLLFKPMARYILSCVPEVELFGLFIVYLGLCLNILREKSGKKTVKLVLTYLIVFFMTLIRPYLILFFILPCVLWILYRGDRTVKKSWRFFWPAAITGIILLSTILIYMLIGKYLCAPYLENLYYTDWLKLFLSGNIKEGLSFTLLRIKKAASEILALLSGYINGSAFYAAGLYYLVYGIMLMVVTGHLFVNLFNRKHKCAMEILLPEIQLYLVAVAFGLADVLMYRIEPGGRHTLIFSLGFLLLLPFINSDIMSHRINDKRFSVNEIFFPLIAVVALVILFGIKGNISYEYALSYYDNGRYEEIRSLSDELYKNIIIDENVISYDNTVIWSVWSNYSDYYALPKGVGISCCTDDYIISNFDKLKCRYLGVARGGELDTMAKNKGAEYIGGSDKVSFYRVR